MNTIELIILGFAAVCASIMSSIAGAGGGFIVTPLMIFLGLSPGQAIATGKIMGFTLALTNVSILRKHKLHSWDKVLPVVGIAIVVGLVAPLFIVRIDGDVYQKFIGILILGMIPVIHFKKIGHSSFTPSTRRRYFGYGAVAGSMSLQALFGSGLGTLVNLSLLAFSGLDALEASVTRRISQLVLNGALILGLVGSGFIVWKVAMVGIIANTIGGTIGAHMAVKKGNEFIMNILKVAMLASGVSMLIL